MEANSQTIQQIDRAIRKIALKFPCENDPILTDIHMLVKADSGEILTYDDDDNELNRCVVEEWINNTDDDFYAKASELLSSRLQELRDVVESMSILRPFSFVLIDEDHETLNDLIYIDDEDTIVLQGDLLKDLDKDLDSFLKNLLEE